MKNKSICFIANFHKTRVFDMISKELLTCGVDIYWIVTKDSQYRNLAASYGEDHVLSINRNYIKEHNLVLDDFRLNELVYGDRVWKYDKKNGLKYLTNIQSVIYNFIKSHCISFIFGEVTWAHELLIHRICNQRSELNCLYYSIAGIRIPNGRICFFIDEKQSIILDLSLSKLKSHSNVLFHVEKPEYLKINDMIIKKSLSVGGKLKRLKRLLTNENIEQTDPNILHGIYRIIIPFCEEIHRVSYQWVRKASIQFLENKKYIYFGFHKQPEASIDVCGRYFENQFENVLNIWRQLPPDWFLVIKEHSNAIGDRGYRFFWEIMKYPGIIIVDEKADSYQIIRGSELVMTNTGTMALEAALMGIPAITLSPVFFNKLNYCRHCIWTDLEKYSSIEILISEMRALPDNREEYQDFIVNNSIEGVISDVMSLPTVLDADNLNKLTAALQLIID